MIRNQLVDSLQSEEQYDATNYFASYVANDTFIGRVVFFLTSDILLWLHNALVYGDSGHSVLHGHCLISKFYDFGIF